MLSRFFYNSSSMACETFLYGGCLGNGNNFYSEKECLQACRTEGERGEHRGGATARDVPLLRHQRESERAACRLPIAQGPCQKPVTRWAFDAAQGKCIMFSYGGCKGNGNQFYSEKECKEYCGAPPLAGTPTLPAPCPHHTALRWGSQAGWGSVGTSGGDSSQAGDASERRVAGRLGGCRDPDTK
uniref:BPTI/Kunitz inhibitor domain-containing protein n=1 Tax=Bubo bubo TaxID=30461 RepID=A0A8C0FN50_BUBBB